MRSAGKLVDPLILSTHGRGSPTLLGRLVRWSAEAAASSATAHCLGGLGSRAGAGAYVRGWSKPAFLASASSDVRALFAALSSGAPAAAVARLAPALSEGMSARLLRGAAASRAAAGGAQQCADVLRELAPPELLQARFVYAPPAPGAGIAAALAPRPTHAQLTVRVRLLLRHWVLAEAGAPGKAAGGGGGGRAPPPPPAPISSAGSAAAAARARLIRPDDWAPALDAASGLVYWHTAAAAAAAAAGEPPAAPARTSWAAPPPAATLWQAPWRLEACGAEREPVAAGSAEAERDDDGSGAPLARVALVAVFERAIPPAAAAAAAAAASAATERWRLVHLI
jgi:hypothetical protein